ncbi:hypothetical protein BC827DRAFT_1140804, partial [Russula dissimulans]
LLNSGATECFLRPKAAQQMGIPTTPLQISKQVKNVNGTTNISGAIKNQAYLTVSINRKEKMLQFYLVNIGSEEMILGYPFLEALDPKIDWLTTSVLGKVTAFLPQKKRETAPEWIKRIKGWEEGDKIWW